MEVCTMTDMEFEMLEEAILLDSGHKLDKVTKLAQRKASIHVAALEKQKRCNSLPICTFLSTKLLDLNFTLS